jgi:hypothetical protein
MITLDSISLHQGIQGERVSFTVFGQKIGKKIGVNSNVFYLIQGSSRLYPSKVTNINEYEALVEFDISYEAALGGYDFVANNPAANFTILYNAFEVLKGSNSPRIVAPFLDTVSLGEFLQIEVTGINTDFTQGSNTVHFRKGDIQIPITALDERSPTTFMLTAFFTKDLPNGPYSLSIANSSGLTLTRDSAIVINDNGIKPTIVSLSENTAFQNESISFELLLANSSINSNNVYNTIYLTNNLNVIYASKVRVLGDNEIEANFKFNQDVKSGWYTVIVENRIDGKIKLNNAFYIKELAKTPSIVSIDKDTVQQGEYLDIVVTTENLDFTQGSNLIHLVYSVTGQKISASNFSILDSNHLKFTTIFTASSSLGHYDLTLSYAGSTEQLTYSNAFFVTSIDKMPVIDSLSTSIITQGENMTVSVYSSNTHFIKEGLYHSTKLVQGNTFVYPESVTLVNDTLIDLHFKIHYGYDTGYYDLVVYNNFDGTLKLENSINILAGFNAPKIVSVTIDTVKWFETVNIDLQSENMDFTKGTNTITLSRNGEVRVIYDVLVNNENSLTFTQNFDDTYEEGYYDIAVTNSETQKTMVKARALYVKSDLIDANNKAIIASEISFYPNPSNGQLHLNQTVELLEVFDLNGKKLLEFKNIDFVNIEGVDLGTYLLKITNVGDSKIEKLVIK